MRKHLLLTGLLLFSFAIVNAQWTNVNSGINDNLNDIYAHKDKLHAVAAGSKGIYYTKTGGDNAAAWARFAPSNSTDLALYNRCRFTKIDGDPSNFKVWVIGQDTVNGKAVIFSFKTDDQTYAVLYTGAANSELHDIRWASSAVYAVGSKGLVIDFDLYSFNLVVYPAVTTKTLRAIGIYGNTSAVIGGDNILLKGTMGYASLQSVDTLSSNYTITSIHNSGYNFIAVGPDGAYSGFYGTATTLAPITHYKFGPLNATSVSKTYFDFYITTDHGIYKLNGGPLEFQPSSAGYNISGMGATYNRDMAFACGKNGLILKSTNVGGPTIPYVSATLTTGCKGDFIDIDRVPGGSGNDCKLLIYNSSNTLVQTLNTNCAYGYSWGNSVHTGALTMKYIVSNGSFSDSIIFTTFIPDPPAVNLSTTFSDTILCKSESINIGLAGTVAGWDYILKRKDSIADFGRVGGTGGNALLLSKPISATDIYLIQVASQTNGCVRNFTNVQNITVEQPKGRLFSQYINTSVNEPVTFTAVTKDAQYFKWEFDNTASQSTVTGKSAQVTYNSTGPKTTTLISWSANGCYDTASLYATRVISEAGLSDNCFMYNVAGQDVPYNTATPSLPLQEAMKPVSDGFIIGGGGYAYSMRSAAGDTLAKTEYGGLYLAKYSSQGVLKWRWYSKYTDYNCSGCNYIPKSGVKDVEVLADQSIVFAGVEHTQSFLYFSNGDSVKIANTSSTSTAGTGFIAKVNAQGSLQWRGVFVNASVKRMKQDKFGNFWVLCSRDYQTPTYVTGNGTSVTFDNIPFEFRDRIDVLVKLSSNGTYLTSTRILHLGVNAGSSNDFVIDNNGYPWITGVFESSAKFYNSDNTVAATAQKQPSVWYFSAYLAKYSPNCDYLFHINAGTVKTTGISYEDAEGNKLATDASGNIYMLGYTGGRDTSYKLSFVHSAGGTNTISLGGFFLAKFDQNGAYQWTNGTRYESYSSRAHTIATTNNSVLITSNITSNPSTPWTGKLTSTDAEQYGLTINSTSFLVAEYDHSGKMIRLSQSNSNQGGSVHPNTIERQNGKVYISGQTSTGNGGGASYSVYGQSLASQGADGFFMVLNDNMCYSGAAPVADAGPDKTSCSGTAVTLGSAAVPNTYYSWTSSPAGFTAHIANPSVTPQVTTTYYLSVVNSSGIVSKDSVVVNISGGVANGGPDKQICGTGSVTIGAPPTQGTTYAWTSSPAGFISTAAEPTVSPTVTTTYYLQASNNGGCVGKDTVVVKVSPVPVANAGPDERFCIANGGYIGTPAIFGNTYSWSTLAGGFYSLEARTLVFPQVFTTYILTVTSNAGCVARDTVNVYVTKLAKPTITANGPTSFCPGGGVILTSSFPDSLQWSRNGFFLSDTTRSITATLGGEYVISYRDSGCYSPLSDPFVITVLTPPAPPTISTTDPTIFCGAASTLLQSSATTGNQWYLDGNPIAGATGQSYLATGSGYYNARVTGNGCLSAWSNAVQVTSNFTPPTPTLTTSSPTNICSGNTVSMHANGNGSFQWYRDGNLISGASDSSYAASVSGVYTVKQVMNGCLSPASGGITVNVTTVPTPSITPAPPGIIGLCAGDSILLLSNALTGNQWYYYGNAIPNATARALVVRNSGAYSVKQSANGCTSAFSNSVTIQVNTLPSAPVITQAGTLLISSSSTGNKWYLDGNLIPGATSQTYNATASGVYHVKVFIGSCAGPVSNSITINLSQSVTVGPNPTHGIVNLSYLLNTSPITVKVMNLYGLVLKQDTFINSYQLDLSGLPNGYYIIHMINPQTGWQEQRTVLKM